MEQFRRALPLWAKRSFGHTTAPDVRFEMLDKPVIEKIHLTAIDPAGERLAVVTFTNGQCGITRDGQAVQGLEWPVDQMPQCTIAFARLAGLDDESNPHAPAF
jgi:hypothetical protein